MPKILFPFKNLLQNIFHVNSPDPQLNYDKLGDREEFISSYEMKESFICDMRDQQDHIKKR